MTGAMNVDPEVIHAARMLGAKERQIFTTVVIPASVPAIFAGLQVGISSAWASVVAAEMIKAENGLGWIIQAGMDTFFSPLGIPTLTGPFCVATWLFLWPHLNLDKKILQQG